MHVKSAVDIRNKAMIFTAIFLMTAGALYLSAVMDFSSEMRLVGLLSALLASFLLLWLLFGTSYELRRDNLCCRYGPFSEIIPFDTIISLTLCSSTISSPAMSSNRIDILWYDNGEIIETMISPKNRARFLAHLQDRCRYLEQAA